MAPFSHGLLRIPEPFDHPDFLRAEARWFPRTCARRRAPLLIVSRNGNVSSLGDLLMLNGRDRWPLPLTERKRRLASIMPAASGRVLFVDSITEGGRELFQEACRRDLEGIVAKWAQGTYQTDTRRTSWLKIKNAAYSQLKTGTTSLTRVAIGRGERSRSPRPWRCSD